MIICVVRERCPQTRLWAQMGGAASSVVAGGSEAGDRGGDVGAGLVGVDGGAALRREREPGFRLAKALSRRGGAGGPVGSQLMPVTVTPDRAVAAQPRRWRATIEIELAGGYRVRVGDGVKAKRCGWCWTYWSGDDPGSLGGSGVAGGRPHRHEARHERPGVAGPGSAAAAILMPAIFTFSEVPEAT